jgi:hypothetical protein
MRPVSRRVFALILTALTLELAVIVGTVRTDAATSTGTGTGTGTSTGARYFSLFGGRGQAVEAVGCEPAPGAVDIMTVVRFAHSVGVPLSPNLVPDYLDRGQERPDGRDCRGDGTQLYMSWADAATIRDQYGGHAVTSGLMYRDMSTLNPFQQHEEACGARDALEARGHFRVRGLFAGANPGGSPLGGTALVAIRDCGYVWARDYGDNTWPYEPRVDGQRIPTNVRTNMHPDGYLRVLSLNGGDCPSWAACGSGGSRDYMDAGQIIADIRVAPGGSYFAMQIQRIVSGKGPLWDCDSVGPHWTAKGELYCWNDLQQILNALPADYVATDPLTVAQAWGVQ